MRVVVDVHNHAVPIGFVNRILDEGEQYGYRLREPTGPWWRTAPPGDAFGSRVVDAEITTPDGEVSDPRPRRTDRDVRARELAAAGIDLYLESIDPQLMAYGADERQSMWGARAINDGFAEDMAALPGRVMGTAHVPLQFPELAAQELERAADLGMRSVQIATNVRGRNLDEPELDPFWRTAEGLGMLVVVHPQYVVGLERMGRYSLRNLIGNPLETSIAVASVIFGGVTDRFPGLKLCFFHAGGYAPWIRGRWRRGYKVRPEARERMADDFDRTFGRIYVDTIIHDEHALRYLIASVGAHRVLHGTDYAADMGDWGQVALIEGMHELSDEDKDDVLGRNALRLIGREQATIERVR